MLTTDDVICYHVIMKQKMEYHIATKHGTYQVHIWWDAKDKAYLVKVPSLPNVVTFGKTLTEAKHMAKDAIELYCSCMIDDGNIVIDDKRRVFGKMPPARVMSIAS